MGHVVAFSHSGSQSPLPQYPPQSRGHRRLVSFAVQSPSPQKPQSWGHVPNDSLESQTRSPQ